MAQPWLRELAEGIEVRLKVVPGSSRDAVAGPLGDRIKVRIAAPPEGGRANRAVEDLLGGLLGRPCRIVAGHGTPLKTLFVAGASAAEVAGVLGG